MILSSMSRVWVKKFWVALKLLVIVGVRGFWGFIRISVVHGKKLKCGVLSVVEKVVNRCFACVRILVEYLYAKVKVFKIVVYRYRNRRKRFGLRMALICGIISFEKRG